MARNTPLDPPPVDTPITSSEKISGKWIGWFQRLHFLNSNKNQQTIIGACAINLDAEHVFIVGSSVSTYAITLDPPTQAGIVKGIEMIAYSGKTVTLALTNIFGGTHVTTCTWSGTSQILLLRSCATQWQVINQTGVTLT